MTDEYERFMRERRHRIDVINALYRDAGWAVISFSEDVEAHLESCPPLGRAPMRVRRDTMTVVIEMEQKPKSIIEGEIVEGRYDGRRERDSDPRAITGGSH